MLVSLPTSGYASLMNWLGWIGCALAAYLLGSIPFGVLIGVLHGVDIREHGSRNIGATNVGRVVGRGWGYLCFLLDAAKGALPVATAGALASTLGKSAEELGAATLWWWLLVAAAALMGHMASPFLGFRGGKGVATGFGALLAIWPLLGIPALIALGIWVLLVLTFRFVSLASMVAALSLPASAAIFAGLSADATPLLIATVLLSLLVVIRHRANIGRLLRGEEPRVGRGAPRSAIGHNGADVRT